MLFFASPRNRDAAERKREALRRMSRADLADIGVKPGDLPRILRQIGENEAL